MMTDDPQKPAPAQRRTDGRYATTAGFVQQLLRQPPQLAFPAGCTATEFESWRRRVRRRLQALLAFPRVPLQPAPVLLDDAPRDGYRLQRWEAYPEPAAVVPFLLLVPDRAAAEPAPAVLCFPGSDHPKEVLAGEPWSGPWENRFGACQHIALHFARAGFVAAAFDNPGIGELSDPRCPDWRRQFGELLWLGRTYEGLSAFQKLPVLHWLRRQPYVDARRIAVCGHSLGAKPALLLGVLDEGVGAVIWNDHLTSWRERAIVTNLTPIGPWHYIPSLLRWFDYPDLMCALAPRPLLVTEGGYLPEQARVRRAYALHHAARRFRVTYMPNFADPRRRSRRKFPEGIDLATYAKYANIDGDHYFKDDVAVPWLCRVFGVK